MAYSATKYQLTHLLQDAWYRLGQMRTWKATSGTTSTIVNTAWAGVEEQIFEDDDPSLIYGTAVVVQDTIGATPEGEMSIITDYDSSLSSITVDAFTVTISANDRIGIASPLFPLQDMIELANIALRKLGEIDIPNLSLTTIAGQTEYTLPSAIRNYPIRVRRRTGDEWRSVAGWNVIPATAGVEWTLYLPEITSGENLEVVYRSLHPELTGYASDISELLHPELVCSALLAEAYQWYNNQVGGSNPYFLQRENKALQDLEVAKVKYPINNIVEQLTGFPHWGRRGDYVPATSDLRY